MGCWLEDKFRAKAAHLLPEIWTLIAAGILTVGIVESKIEIEVITAFPETPSGATMNMTLFIVIMAVIASVMYVLVKYGLERIFRAILRTAIVIVLLILLSWYSGALFAILRMPEELVDGATIVLASTLTIILAYAINRMKGTAQLVSITTLGAMLGTFLGASIPTLTVIVLLVGLSVYDILAVFKGPIGKIAEKTDLQSLSGATFTFGDLTVGLGDLVFYSMLASHTMLSFGLIPYVATSIGIVIGTFLGFKMLERRSIFPGLPLSLISGLGFMLVTLFLQRTFLS